MTIYVSNLSYHLQDGELSNLFAAYGTVTSVKIITQKGTARSKGFGFVEMEDENEGNEAIRKLNGQMVAGRALVVNVAHTKEATSSFIFSSPN